MWWKNSRGKGGFLFLFWSCCWSIQGNEKILQAQRVSAVSIKQLTVPELPQLVWKHFNKGLASLSQITICFPVTSSSVSPGFLCLCYCPFPGVQSDGWFRSSLVPLDMSAMQSPLWGLGYENRSQKDAFFLCFDYRFASMYTDIYSL